MEDDTKHKPKPHKVVLILDGERICFAAFADPEQEKRILEILNEPRYKLAQ